MKFNLLLTTLALTMTSYAQTPKPLEFEENIQGIWNNLEKSNFPNGLKISKAERQSFIVQEEVTFQTTFKITATTNVDQKFWISSDYQDFTVKYSLSGDTLTEILLYKNDATKEQISKYLKATSEPVSNFSLVPLAEWPKKVSNEEATLMRKKSGFYFKRSSEGMSMVLATAKPTKFEDGVAFWKMTKECDFPYVGCKTYVAVKLYKNSITGDYTFEYSIPHDTMEGALDLLKRSNGGKVRNLK